MNLSQLVKHKAPWLAMMRVLPEFLMAALRYARFSGVAVRGSDQTLLAKVIVSYHVLEKGLTMAETRPGFGEIQIHQLCERLGKVAKRPALRNHPQVKHAAGVLGEYLAYHQSIGHEVPRVLVSKIEEAIKFSDACSSPQGRGTPDTLFAYHDGPFGAFTRSRRSVRNFKNETISNDLIHRAIGIAQTCPSSCNRQITQVHVYRDRDQIDRLLDLQSGSRGWSQLVPCLLVVTGDLRMCVHPYERDMTKVDGGMFSMSLMYALHHLKIAACPLNCYFSHAKEKAIRKAGSIPEAQSAVVMIACGYPADGFDLAASPRKSPEEVAVIHSAS
jgi:nitroreductase